MLKSWRATHNAPSLRLPLQHLRHIADTRPFREGDIVLLRQKLDRAAPAILTRPLRPGKQVAGHKGLINHDDIIGKRVRDIVRTPASKRTGHAGIEFRIHEVILDEYVRLTRRLVTPIYPSDARLIVEMLDLHPEAFDPSRDDGDRAGHKLEILEAGTGHGALTLYLSRAIHGANPPPPPLPEQEQPDEAGGDGEYQHWKAKRRAVIHSIEQNAKYSTHAQSIVKGFRNGMYVHNVDFHITDVAAWTRRALAERQGEAFLSHAFLDLPGADNNLDIVSKALRTDGCLVVFQPSITQILECQKKVREEGMALELENVIELGVNGGSGGREWNVKMVKPRAARDKPASAEVGQDGDSDNSDEHAYNATDGDASPTAQGEPQSSGSDTETVTPEEPQSDNEVADHAPRSSTQSECSATSAAPGADWNMICRPKVGDRIVGGGFLGVWRKQRR